MWLSWGTYIKENFRKIDMDCGKPIKKDNITLSPNVHPETDDSPELSPEDTK